MASDLLKANCAPFFSMPNLSFGGCGCVASFLSHNRSRVNSGQLRLHSLLPSASILPKLDLRATSLEATQRGMLLVWAPNFNVAVLLPHCHNLGSSHCQHLESNGWNLWFLFCHEQKGARPNECDAF